MEIVVNEWLLHYLCPDAQESDRMTAVRFVNILVRKCDKMVIKRNSPFVVKFYRFMKQFESDTSSKQRFSKLNRLLFLDSDRTIIADESELKELPKEIADKTPPDDKYLIELWYAKQDRIVLTTDTKLKDKLKDIPGLKICLLQEFLEEYLV